MRRLALLPLLILAASAAPPENPSRCSQRARVNYPLILAYHDQVNAPGDKTLPQDFTLEEFKAHVRALRENGYSFISLTQFYDSLGSGVPLPDKSIALTFDDGFAGSFETYKFLRSEKIKAAFFIAPLWVGRKFNDRPHLEWDQLNEIRKDPLFEIGSHTVSHPDLKTLSVDALTKELIVSRDTIAQRLKLAPQAPFFLSYPDGHYNSASARVAQRYYALAFTDTVDPLGTADFNSGIDPCYQVPRLIVERGLESPEKFILKIDQFRDELKKYEELGSRRPSSL